MWPFGRKPVPAPAPAPRLWLRGSEVRALYSVVASLARAAANVRDGDLVSGLDIDKAIAEDEVSASLAGPAAAVLARLVARAEGRRG